jgi:hypothetical protein
MDQSLVDFWMPPGLGPEGNEVVFLGALLCCALIAACGVCGVIAAAIG